MMGFPLRVLEVGFSGMAPLTGTMEIHSRVLLKDFGARVYKGSSLN